MLTQRPVDPVKDKDFVLDLACMASYESVPAWYKETSYRSYRDGWYKSDFPRQVMDDLKKGLAEPQNLIEVWLEDDQPAGLVWVDLFESLLGRKIAILRDLVVAPGYQRRGIGRLMLREVEAKAQEMGAGVLRIETSVENDATQSMFQHAGFTVSRLMYEKVLKA